MSSKSSSNKNIKDLREQINHLSLNLNPNEMNNNNNKTPLKNVYSNISSPHSSSQVQKLSELEEKLKSIELGPNIDNYYKSVKTENQGIIPQMRRMELLQRKMNLLQNTNEQNSKALQEILEIQMKERLRYPKYTIIQNTPLTPHEEIMNQILQKKLGPGASYSMNYPTVVFKNQNEINEMRNIQASDINNNNNVNNNSLNNNNFGSNRVVFQSNDNKPITVKMIKEIQKEILNLRKTVNELKIEIKEMKNNFKTDLEKDINSNKLLVEIIRKVIEEGGDNKLKSSVEKNFDRKKINIDEIKTDLEIFKTEELNEIINEEINKYDKKMNKILEKMKNDLQRIINNGNNNDDINTNLKINLIEEENKKSSKLNESNNKSKKGSKTTSKKSNSLNLKTEGKNSDDSDVKEKEEEEEEDDYESDSESDESQTYTSGKKSKKNSKSHKSKKSSSKKSSKNS